METRSVVLEEHVDSEYEPTEQEILDYSEWLGMDLENDKDLMWIARAGLKVPLPPPWKPCTTGEENEVFYFNFDTGESVWDHPCDEYHRMLYKKAVRSSPHSQPPPVAKDATAVICKPIMMTNNPGGPDDTWASMGAATKRFVTGESYDARVPVVTGHVVAGPGGAMPSELAHAPWSPPCGPGPSHAPGSFVLLVESAKDLYDLDWTGKMDPYVKVRLGGREFRTQVMTNAGKKAKFHWTQIIDWRGEPDIHFLAMDSNMLVADGLIGEAVYRGLPLHSDFEGTLELMRPHAFGGCKKAGKLKIEITWQRGGARPEAHGSGYGPGAAMPGPPYGVPSHGVPGHGGPHGMPYPSHGGHHGYGPPHAGAGMSAAAAGHMLFQEAFGFGGKKMKKDKKEKKHKKEKKFKIKKMKKYGLPFDEAALEDLAQRLGLSQKEDESGDLLDDSGSVGRSASASGGMLSLGGGDLEKKKKKKEKKEKKPKKEKPEDKDDEVRLEAPRTLAPLSARGVGGAGLRDRPHEGQAEEAAPSTGSSRAPSLSLSEEDRRERPEDFKALHGSKALDGPPRPVAGAPPPPSGDPPAVNSMADRAEAVADASQEQLEQEKARLEELHQKNIAALQAEHKAKLAKHRRELQAEFELERDRTFSELQEKHEKQVREERGRLQQELASKKGKMKQEIEALAKSEEELQKKLSESQAEATRLRSEAASLGRKCSAYDERVRRLEEDMKECRKEASHVRTSASTDAKEVASLKAQLDSKNLEIEQIKAGATSASERLAKWEEEMQRLQDLAQDNDEAKARIEQLMQDLEAKETQRAALEQQIKDQSQSQDAEELSKQKAKIASLEASLMSEVEAKSKLQAKLSETQSDLAKASGNRAQLDELRRELDARTAELAEARKAPVSDSELRQAKDALEEEKRISSQASADVLRFKEDLASLKAELAEERGLNGTSKAEAASASNEASRLEAELAAQSRELQRLQELLDQQGLQAQEEQARLMRRANEEKELRTQAQAELASAQQELAISKGTLSAREGECKRLQDKIGDAVGQHEELRRLQTSLEQATSRATNLKSELDARTADCVQLRAEAQQQERQAALRSMEEASLKAELDTWRAECDRWQSEATQSDVPKMKALLEEEKASLSSMKAEAAETMAQCKAQAAAAAAELEARSKECGRLRAELRACRPSGALPQDEVRELVSLRARVLDLEAEVEAMHQAQKPAADLEESMTLRSMVKDRDDTVSRLRADLVHASARHFKEVEELQAKVNEARLEERQLRHDDNGFVVSDLKAQLRARASEVEQLHSEVRASMSELERTRAEARHAEARAAAREISSVEAAKVMVTDDWKREVDRLQVELQKSTAEIAAAKEKAERANREVRRLQQEESRVAKSQEALRGELEQAQDNNRVIREEMADAEHRCEDARSMVRAERTSRTHAETQVREYQREARALKAQLQERAAEADKFRSEARNKSYQLEDKELEVAHLQDQIQFLEDQIRARRRDLAEKEDWETQTIQKDGPLDITGLKTAVELSQLSQAQGMGDLEVEEQDATLSPCDAAVPTDGSVPPNSPVQEREDMSPPAAWHERAEEEARAGSPPGAEAAAAGCVPDQAAAYLQAKRRELQTEHMTVERLRHQWKQDADRLRSVSGMAREQVLLQEACSALDDRAAVLQRALAEHNALEQALHAGTPEGDYMAFPRTSPPALGITGNPTNVLKASFAEQVSLFLCCHLIHSSL
ncbi:Cep164 [Symbiodinium sp. CCMP2592]|nr:Cep164 [Symbiodinium sp. CCMP2592]